MSAPSFTAGSRWRTGARQGPVLTSLIVCAAFLLVIGIAWVLASGKTGVGVWGLVTLPVLVGSFVWWRQAVYLVFILLFVEGFFRNLLNTPAVLLVKDAVLAVIYLRYLLQSIGERRNPFLPAVGNVPLLIFAALALVQVFNPNDGLLVGLVGMQTLLFNVPLLYVAYGMFRTRAEVDHLLLFIVIATVLIATLGVIQFIRGPQAYASLGASFTQATFVTTGARGQAIYRPNSTFAWPSDFASFLAAATLLLLAALVSRQRLLAGLAMLATPLVIFTDLLSGQRSLYLLLPPLMVLVAILGGLRVSRWLLGVFLVAGLATVALLAWHGGGTFQDRFASIFADGGASVAGHILAGKGNLVDGILASPIGLGTGAAAIGARYVNGGSIPLFLESYYGELAAELSVLGLAAFVWVSVKLVLAAASVVARFTIGSDRALAGAGLAFLLLVSIVDVGSNDLDLAVNSVFFWFLAGLVLRLPGLAKPSAFAAGARATPRGHSRLLRLEGGES